MARSRNIKPGLFKNEDLAECSIWARYLFPGLWCIADRSGRLEDRPKRIKGELLAFDSVDVEPLLDELAKHGFIARYEVDGQRIIQILTFGKHQNPHFREQPSELPPMPGWQAPEPMTEKPEAQGGSKPSKARGKPEALSPSQPTEASGKPEASPRHSTDESDLQRGSSPADSLFSDSLFSDSSNSVPDGTGSAAAKSPEELTRSELWSAGKSLLSQAGMPPAQCGSFVGKLVKDYGETVVVDAVRAAVVAQPADPAQWLKAACLRAVGQRGPGRQQLRHTDFDKVDYTAGVNADGTLPA
jgi:hypothetical protein